MNNCIIFTSREHEDYLNDSYPESKVYFISDYVKSPNIKETRKFTESIFASNEDFLSMFKCQNYLIGWSWFDETYQLAKNYISIKSLIEELNYQNHNQIIAHNLDNKFNKILKLSLFDKKIIIHRDESKKEYLLKFLTINFLYFVVSFLMFIFLIFKRPKVALYTGDYVYQTNDYDLRLRNLYNILRQKNIYFFEFIRPNKFSSFIKNILLRRRFAIYFTFLQNFLNYFYKKKVFHESPKNIEESFLFNLYGSNLALEKTVNFYRRFFRYLKLEKFVAIEFSSRNAGLVIAAKLENVKTIGIMHGLQRKEDSCHEFMENFNDKNKLGCDFYGLWSDYYLSYYKKYSKVFDHSGLEVSGLLRPPDNLSCKPYKRVSGEKIYCLIISELHLPINECYKFYLALLECENMELAIKSRPMIEDFFVKKLCEFDRRFEGIRHFSCDIEDIADKFDVFIGTNSTAVLEASIFNRISILFETKTFKDYFEIDSLISNKSLLIKDYKSICKEIEHRVNNEKRLNTINKIKNRFFGSNENGAKWVLHKINS